MARRLGAAEAWIRAARQEVPENGVQEQGNWDGLPPAWSAAIRYAERVTASAHDVTDDVYAELARHWQPGEIIEITMVVGLFSYFNRFNDALRVEITR